MKTNKNIKPAEIKKLENGNLAVRWQGKRSWNVIDMKKEELIGVALIAMMAGIKL